MANQLQLVIYEGYLGRDPEMRYTPSGKNVTNFSMGSSRKYKTADGKEVKETTWLKVTAWGKLGEIVNQYCNKGSHVIVTGILRVGENGSPTPYQTKSGEWAASYEITASDIRILDKKESGTSEDETEGNSEEDLPFE